MTMNAGEAQHDPVSGMSGGIWTYYKGLVTALAGLTESQTVGLRKFCEAIAGGVIDEINANFSGGGGGGGSSFYQTIKSAASSLTQRAALKFDGTLIRATDDGVDTVVDPFGLTPSSRQISSGAGLQGGGDLSVDRTLSIANAAVTNAMLAGSIDNSKLVNNTIGFTAGAGLAGGGTPALGSSASLSVPNSGITNAMLAGSIDNSKLLSAPTAGQKDSTYIVCGSKTSHGSSTYRALEQIAINPSDAARNGTTLTAIFRVVAAMGSTPLTGHVRLYNVTDAEIVATSDFTTTVPTKVDATLTIGTSSGNLKSSEKVYEVRIWVDAPINDNDFVRLGSAFVIFQNTY